MTTRKRVLFVDDEAFVLQGLQRMFRSMRAEWDMAFAESGAQALEFLAAAPADVVVSDMRMPGMDGSKLLHAVKDLYPRTIRLVLSGYADQELVLACVGVAHQFLAKPCDPEKLKAVIRQTLALDNALHEQGLRRLASQLVRLPSLPSLYAELLAMLQRPHTDVRDVARVVGQDIAMTAEILRLVNSSFFGLGHRVAGTREAVERLGMETIKALVLAVHLFEDYRGRPARGLNLAELWRHSQQTGAVARGIVLAENGDQAHADEAFVSGLLHDVGKLVLWDNLPGPCEEVRKVQLAKGITLCQAEREVLGATHAEVGGYLLGLWGLPCSIVEATCLHHTPTQSPSRTFGTLTAVHVADGLVEDAPTAGGRESQGPDLAYLKALGLGERLAEWKHFLEGNPSLMTGE